jgi:hypothetical protein
MKVPFETVNDLKGTFETSSHPRNAFDQVPLD